MHLIINLTAPIQTNLITINLNKFFLLSINFKSIDLNNWTLSLSFIDLVPSDDGVVIIRQKAKWGGNTASSSENYSEDVPLFTSSEKEVIEETKTLSEEPLNKGPPKSHKEKLWSNNIHTTRKGPFAYKVFKEDSMPIPNTRIEIEKKNVEIKWNKIGEINYVFNLHSGLYQQRSFDIDQYGIYKFYHYLLF